MRKHGYPVDKLGNVLGPEKYDPDCISSEEQVRRRNSSAANAWYEERRAKAREARAKREA